jgi:DNA-directed RNA polymerase specialized sigma24 family protein
MEKPPPKGHDRDICPHCRNVGLCLHPCYPITWIDGNKPRKETLLRDDYDRYQNGSYNDELAFLIEEKRDEWESIQAILDPRKKAIAAMLYSGLSLIEITAILGCSERSLRRWRK